MRSDGLIHCQLALQPHGVTKAGASEVALPDVAVGRDTAPRKDQIEMGVKCCLWDHDNLPNHHRKSHGSTWLLKAFTLGCPEGPLRNPRLLGSFIGVKIDPDHIFFVFVSHIHRTLGPLDTTGHKCKGLGSFSAWRALQRAGG